MQGQLIWSSYDLLVETAKDYYQNSQRKYWTMTVSRGQR